jgi:tRNA (guanine10-N2)-methyltransferase
MPFRFTLDCYRGTRKEEEQRVIIESFSYLGFQGPVRMREPDVAFRVFEDYEHNASKPKYLYMGRFIASSGRQAKTTYDLKKRHYISTTSMDAELALLTANIALAAPGKIFYDPFMGTGGFPVASAHFGAVVCGSDIDGRSIRGTGGSSRRGQVGKRDVAGNFQQYKLQGSYLGAFISDLTNSPLRLPPPDGIREGLKVLGSRDQLNEVERATHAQRYQDGNYIPPKRPYSFLAMLDDILAFAAITLVENGRLSMWMPTANDEDVELVIPSNMYLQVVSVCVQPFNKWSRRLLTYRRLRDDEVKSEDVDGGVKEIEVIRGRASDLNDFRRKYFQGFREFEQLRHEAGRTVEGLQDIGRSDIDTVKIDQA